MGRAERRRQEKLKNQKPRTYTLTDVEIDEMKKDIAAQAVNTAMTLMLVLPMEVLMDHYWPKTYAKKIPEFTQHVLDMYGQWVDGKLDMEKLKADLWEYGGVRLEETE